MDMILTPSIPFSPQAGITTTLNSRCSVLAAANSVFGRWDETKGEDNIDFMPTILSRFDMIFIVKDEHNEERDMVGWGSGLSWGLRHIWSIHSHSVGLRAWGRSKTRLWADLIATLNSLKGDYKKEEDRLLRRICCDGTRGNGFKLKEGRFTLDIRKKVFLQSGW